MTFAVADVAEVALVGDPNEQATRDLLEPAWRRWRPNQVTALAADDSTASASAIPLLTDRVAREGRPTAYVCHGFVCDLPVTTAEALEEQLAR